MENYARSLSIIVGVLLVSACSTSRIKSDLAADEIVSSSNGKKEFPEWVFESPRSVEDGVLYVSGGVDVNSMQSPSRGLDAALMVARSNLSAELKTRLESQAQYASMGMEIDQQQISQIINSESRVDRLNGSFIAKKWYGKVVSQETGTMQARYRCFVLVGIPMQMFQSQLLSALQGDSGATLPAEFKKKVDESWGRFFSDGTDAPQGKLRAESNADTSVVVDPRRATGVK